MQIPVQGSFPGPVGVWFLDPFGLLLSGPDVAVRWQNMRGVEQVRDSRPQDQSCQLGALGKPLSNVLLQLMYFSHNTLNLKQNLYIVA